MGEVVELRRLEHREQQQASLDYVRGQRDALLLAAKATVMFHAIGGLVTRDQVEEWRALTGDADFSAAGLFGFVQGQLRAAGAV